MLFWVTGALRAHDCAYTSLRGDSDVISAGGSSHSFPGVAAYTDCVAFGTFVGPDVFTSETFALVSALDRGTEIDLAHGIAFASCRTNWMDVDTMRIVMVIEIARKIEVFILALPRSNP